MTKLGMSKGFRREAAQAIHLRQLSTSQSYCLIARNRTYFLIRDNVLLPAKMMHAPHVTEHRQHPKLSPPERLWLLVAC
jgi:hypothetical protein